MTRRTFNSWRFGNVTAWGVMVLQLVAFLGCQSAEPRMTDRFMPHGQPSNDNIVRVEKSVPKEVHAGAEFEYDVEVTNVSDFMLHDVAIREFSPGMPEKRESTPRRSSRGEDESRADDNVQLTMLDTDEHHVGTLAPGASRTIRMTTTISDPGKFNVCTAVTYTPVVCASGMAVRPELGLTKSGPASALVGDDIAYTIVVTNNGVGPARNVSITDVIPDGLRSEGGQKTREFEVGTLPQGQSRTYTVEATATRTGTFVNRATARASRGLKATAQATTLVRQPQLTIEKSGPETEYTNVGVKFAITVRNTGDAPARNVVLTDGVPDGVKFLTASDGGRPIDNEIRWQLGTIEPKGSRSVSVRFEGAQPRTIRNCAVVQADRVQPVTDCAVVRLEGVSALLLEVIDTSDPIKIGEQEMYVITVTNQGNRPATNIAIEAILDSRTEFVSMTGSTPQVRTVDGVRARPVGSLAPKQQAQWKIVVEGRRSGDSRFRVQLTSDQLDRPVNEAESTRIFD